jgi:uncharacterized protein YbbC (DUF1343 family)
VKIHLFVGFLLACVFLFGLCKTPQPVLDPIEPEIVEDSIVVEMPPVAKVDTILAEPTLPAIRTGAEQFEQYQALLHGKKLGLVVNQSSLVGGVHLVDTLLALKMDIGVLFAPEHGFRGEADAGAEIVDSKDPATGLEIISLYGSRKKPTPADLSGIDMVLFDIQDVGARFYTYLSTLHYVMEACAEQGIPVMVLDRPNPNAHYIDGPVLKEAFSSFVGLHPVPVVYGMTIGEYARMINGEGWLANGVSCSLEVIPLQWYDHDRTYELPVRPSPNLPNQRAIYLYPSLCFFEGTQVNAGRGTSIPFQCFGAPKILEGNYYFVPLPNAGARYPKHNGLYCQGQDLSGLDVEVLKQQKQLNLNYLLWAYTYYAEEAEFFLSTGFFDLLAGTDQLRLQVIAGKSEEEIRASWAEDLEAFRQIRAKYLLYGETN